MPSIRRWENVVSMEPRVFDCGYCGKHVTSELGFRHPSDRASGGGAMEFIYICACGKPTYFPDDPATHEVGQIPGALGGHDVKGLPPDVAAVWSEIRRGAAAGVYSLAVMGCRKMLMHVAVDKGAKVGLGFLEYVTYLDDEGYVTRNGKPWVERIQKEGNRPNHKIVLSSKEDAERLIRVCELLLKMIYEMPLNTP